MTRSALCTYENITSNHSDGRGGNSVCKITPHYMCAYWSGEQCADYFASTARQASSNYCIGVDGDIAMSVDEDDRAWTSASGWNDRQAITIECGNNDDSSLNDATWESLVSLCADICGRYGFRLSYDGTRDGSLTEHRMFASTDCPGEWLHVNMSRLADEVNARLDGGYAPSGEETPGEPGALEVDGYWGVKTTRGLQEFFGTECDGVVSSQWSGDAWRHAGCPSFEHDESGYGSQLIRAIQQRLNTEGYGLDEDGLCGERTIDALITHYQGASGATIVDGRLDSPSITIKAMQAALNEGRF
jgi:N-acetyl-anhydromuramyl-L-alanine amidase AmpD